MSAGASEAHSEAVAVRDDLVYVPVVVREGGHNLLQPLDVGLEVLLGGIHIGATNSARSSKRCSLQVWM